MRTFYLTSFFLTIFLALLSCSKNQIEYNQLTKVSWKMKDVINSTGQNVSEKTTYTKNGKTRTEMRLNGKIIETFEANYSINKSKESITIEFQKIKKEYHIEKLNNSEFDIKDLKSGKIIRNIKTN